MILKLNCPNKCCRGKKKIEVSFSREEMQRCLDLADNTAEGYPTLEELKE